MRIRHRVTREHLLLLLVLALGWSFWLYRLGINDLGDGEANELMFASGSFRSVIFDIRWPDQSPLYFVLLHFWRAFGESPFAVRTLNLAIVSLTVLALYRLAALLLVSRRLAAVVALVAVTSPLSLWMVRSGRMYPLFVLLSILSIYHQFRYRQTGETRQAIFFVLACTFSIYTHFLGFLTAALVSALWLIDLATNRPRPPLDDPHPRQEPTLFRAPFLVFAAIVLLVLPQIVRVMSLLRHPPALGALSLPGLSVPFLNEVIWFSFINSNWGVSRSASSILTAVYLVCMYLLFCVGAVSSRRLERLAALWIALPVVLLGVMASRLDLRDRYFLYMIPVFWIAVVNGAAGAVPFARRLYRMRVPFEIGRRALFVAIVSASLWLLVHKLPERYVEWTKLMHAVDRLYRPTMSVYMPPGSARGIPMVVAAHEKLNPAFQSMEILEPSTRRRFQDEVAQGREFLFLVQDGFRNEEMDSRAGLLEQMGYRKTVVRVLWASAELFTQAGVDAFVRTSKLEEGFSRAELLEFVAAELRKKEIADRPDSRIGAALAVRAYPDGSVKQSVFYMSQRGEDGYWKLGPAYWDAVYATRASSGGIDRDLIYAHPADGSVLVVAFPGIRLERNVKLVYGIADSGLGFQGGADVKVEVYLDRDKLAEIICSNTPGWKHVSVNSAQYRDREGTLAFLISTENERYRHFHFDFETS